MHWGHNVGSFYDGTTAYDVNALNVVMQKAAGAKIFDHWTVSWTGPTVGFAAIVDVRITNLVTPSPDFVATAPPAPAFCAAYLAVADLVQQEQLLASRRLSGT